MKKTQFIELIVTIKKTLVSFISITFFVLLGVAIFLGIDWSVTGFKNTVNSTLNNWNMHDVSLTFPYGFSEEEINKIKELDYVDSVEGQNSFEAYFVYNDYRYQAKITSLTNKIDDAHKVIGKIPSKKGEIGFERYWAENNGINIGDTIVFEHDDDGTAYSIYNLLNEDLDALQENSKTEDGMLYLNTDTFVITGFFENATYINQDKVTYGVSATTSIPNDCIVYVSEDSIDLKSFNGYRTIVLTSPELRNLNTLDDEYKNKNNDIVDKLQKDLEPYVNKTNEKILNSINNIRQDINTQIQDGEKELIKAEKEINNGEKKIKDGEKQIAEGKIELAKAKVELDNAKPQLDAGFKEYSAGLAEYNSGKSRVDQLSNLYDGFMTAIEVYKTLENASSIINTYYGQYVIANSTAKAIIENLNTEAANKIEEFFSDYQNGVYDGDVTGLAVAIKGIVNATGYEDLKTILNNADKTDDSVNALLQIIDFFDSVNEGIDDTLQIYELYKTSIISDILEYEVINLTQEQISKLENALDLIKTTVDGSYDDAIKYAKIVEAILTKYESTVESVKTKLETELKPQIVSAYAQLADAKAQLDSAYSTLVKGQREYENGLALYENGIKEIENNEKLLVKAKADLKDGKKKLEEGKEELEIAKNKAKDFDEKTKEIENYDITLLGRNLNGGIASTVVPVDMMSSIKYTMALLFVIVGVFVCYSALSRSVYDQTIQIGTKKALGLSKREITISFLYIKKFNASFKTN